MAISSALSFLSDRKRPIAISVALFILLSSLFLLLSPAPSALPFFFSPTSRFSSSSFSPVAASAPLQTPMPVPASAPPRTPIPVPADASPPETPVGISGGSSNGSADLPPADTAASASKAAANALQQDHTTPPPAAAAEVTTSVHTKEITVGVSGGRVAEGGGGGSGGEEKPVELPSWELCEVGKRAEPADYIPCLDNVKAVSALKSMRHMEHRERHCPTEPRPRCLVPLPAGYRLPVPWPRSRDMVRMPALLVFFGKP